MSHGYDVMQVCLNGHQITTMAESSPEFCEDFCSDCGASTIKACPKCQTPIRGYYHSNVISLGGHTPIPKYCYKCGEAYPWHAAAIENLKEVLRDGGLTDLEIGEAEKALPDIVRETPKTELATLKFGRLIKKLGKPAYEIAIKIIADVGAEASKKHLGLS